MCLSTARSAPTRWAIPCTAASACAAIIDLSVIASQRVGARTDDPFVLYRQLANHISRSKPASDISMEAAEIGRNSRKLHSAAARKIKRAHRQRLVSPRKKQ